MFVYYPQILVQKEFLNVSCSGFEFSIDLPLFGTFNVENILATLATLDSMGWSGEEISVQCEM